MQRGGGMAANGASRSFRASRRRSPDERTAVAEQPTWELIATGVCGLPAGRSSRVYRGYVRHRRGEEQPGELPYTPYRIPVYSNVEDKVSARYVRS